MPLDTRDPLIDKTSMAFKHLKEGRWLHALTDLCLIQDDVLSSLKGIQGSEDLIQRFTILLANTPNLNEDHLVRLNVLAQSITISRSNISTIMAPQTFLSALVGALALNKMQSHRRHSVPADVEELLNSKNQKHKNELSERIIVIMNNMYGSGDYNTLFQKASELILPQNCEPEEFIRIFFRDIQRWIIAPTQNKFGSLDKDVTKEQIIYSVKARFGFEYISSESATLLLKNMEKYQPFYPTDSEKILRIANTLLEIFASESSKYTPIDIDELSNRFFGSETSGTNTASSSRFLKNLSSYALTNSLRQHRKKSYTFITDSVSHIKNNAALTKEQKICHMLNLCRIYLLNTGIRKQQIQSMLINRSNKTKGKQNKFVRILIGSLQDVFGLTTAYDMAGNSEEELSNALNDILSFISFKISQIQQSFFLTEGYRFNAISKLLNYAVISEHEAETDKKLIGEAFKLASTLLTTKTNNPTDIVNLFTQIKNHSLPMARKSTSLKSSRDFQIVLSSVRDGLIPEVFLQNSQLSLVTLISVFYSVCSELDVSSHAYKLVHKITEQSPKNYLPLGSHLVNCILARPQIIHGQHIDINEFFYHHGTPAVQILSDLANALITEHQAIPNEIKIGMFIVNSRIMAYCEENDIPLDKHQLCSPKLFDEESILNNLELIHTLYDAKLTPADIKEKLDKMKKVGDETNLNNNNTTSQPAQTAPPADTNQVRDRISAKALVDRAVGAVRDTLKRNSVNNGINNNNNNSSSPSNGAKNN
jgi:hypothetical protein